MVSSKIMTMCRTLCVITSAWFQARTRPSRFPPSFISELDEEDSADDDDEWGVLHAPRVDPYTQTCRVKFVTESHGVHISLVLAVSSCYHAPPELRLQRTRAVWTFSSVDNHSTHSVRVVQTTTFPFSELVSSHFDAYVSDRLEFAAHRHSQRTGSSRLYRTPRLTALTPEAVNVAATMSQVLHRANTTSNQDAVAHQVSTCISHQNTKAETRQLRDGHHHATIADVEKPRKIPRMQPFDVDPRYMDYEYSASYCSRRRANAERRCAFQSSSACKKDNDPTSAGDLVDNWKQMQSRINQASSRLFAFEMDPAWQDRCKHNKARCAKLQAA